MIITCEFDFCIYNESGKCDLEEININAYGMCEECMLPNIPENILNKYKKKLLDKFEK
jgi:hypothetical protein